MSARRGVHPRRSHALGAERTHAALALALVLIFLTCALSAVASARPIGAGAAGAAALPPAEKQAAPKVTKQPTNKTFKEGETATFESTASGTPTPTEQWEVSTDGGSTFTPIEGATTSVLMFSAAAAQNGNEYRTRFKNSLGEAVSNAATLTVHYGPLITKEPKDVVVNEGEAATFEAAASGNPTPTLKWEVSMNGGGTWKAVTGQTSEKLVVEATKSTESGWEYRAVFKVTGVSEATSRAAMLTVQKPPAVTKQPASTTVNEGEAATFEASASGFPAPTIQWEVSSDGGSTWSEVPGASTSPLVLEALTHEQDGYEYRATFTNAAGHATSSAATLTVHSAPKIVQQPQSEIVQAGEEATFEAAATGFPTPTVQWEVSTNGGSTFAPIEGATSDQLTIASAQVAQNNNEYHALFSNESGKTASVAAVLTVATTKYNALAWGENLYRQLGNGSNNAEFDVPVQVSGLKFVVAVAGGGRHSLALIANGKVDAWGSDESGQLGDGGTKTESTPVEVAGLSGVKAVAAGGAFSLAVTSSGSVDAWGDNESGQLGTGSLEESSVPVAVSGLSGVSAIAAGGEHALALLSNGTVKAWGANESGQLGTGNLKSSSTPVAVKGLSGVVAIAAGEHFSLALLSNGKVKAWGSNQYGQLGNAEVEEDSDVPVEVESLSGVSAVAAGAKHALALLSNGTVMAWGEDKAGELGNGVIKTDEEKPVPVTGLSGVSAIAAGSQDSVALVGGAVRTWGTNTFGQLGDGKVGGSSDVPVEVLGIRSAASISAGAAHMLAFGEPLPAVTEVSPAVGATGGGTTVTISGANLGGATSVMFGSTAATSFTVNSATSITATAPAEAAGTIDVLVTTPAGTSPKTAADHYTFEGPPTVTKLSVKSGPVGGGTTVVITGTEFSGASAVSFGATPAAAFTVTSNTSITATVPAGAPGKVHVTVTNLSATSAPTAKDQFTYTPTVTSVTPDEGPATGGTSVTVTGTGFAQGSGLTIFLFGKAKATGVVCASMSECTMTAPAGSVGTVNVIAEANKVKSPVNSPADAFAYR